MRLHNFFIRETIGEKSQVEVNDPDLFHQLRNVFRLNAGSQVILLDNSGFEYLSQIASFDRGNTMFHVVKREETKNVPRKEVYLFQSIIKKDNFEWVLEKGTELGVSHFVPLVTDRSEKKKINMERGEKIIKEASEQSGRGILPKLYPQESLEHIFNDLQIPFIAFDDEGEKFSKEKYKNETKVGICIGPEGGWTDKELAFFKEKKIPIYSLGNQTLRAETAAIVASSLFLLDF